MRSSLLLALVEVACAWDGLAGVREHVSRWWNDDLEPSNRSHVVRIGAALSLSHSDDFNVVGRAMQRGFELYFDMLNRVQGGIWIGGVLNAVEVTWIDDRTGGDRIAAITERLIDVLGIRLLLGPHNSKLTAPAAKIAQQRGALLVAPGTSDEAILRGQPFVFSTLPPPAQMLAPAIELVKESGAKSLAILQEDSVSMHEACGSMVELSKQHNLAIVLNWSLEHNAPTELLESAVARMKETAPDVVIGCVSASVCHGLLEVMQQQDFNPKAVVFTACVTARNFLNDAGAVGQYVVGTAAWAPDLPLVSELTLWNATTFSQHYALDFNDQEPPYEAALAFSTCEALVFAIEQAGSTDPDLVASALQRMDKQSIFGRIAFDENGRSLNQAKVVQFQQSSGYLVVGPKSEAESPWRYPKPTWTEMKCFETSKYFRYGFVRDPNTGVALCQQCPAGKVGVFKQGLSHRVCEHCAAGHSVNQYPDKEEETFCQRCPGGTFSTEAGPGDKCSACPAGQYQSSTGQTACIDCPAGRFAAVSGSTHCAQCGLDPSSPSFSSRNGSEQCTLCPKHGLCEPDEDGLFTSYTNQDGYCMYCQNCENGSAMLHRCPHGRGKACLARGRCHTDPKSQKPTSEGPLCGTCRPGFGRSDWLFGLCEECPSVPRSIAGMFLAVVVTNAITAGMVLTTFLHDFSKPSHVHSAIIKQFMNYVQMAALAFSATEFHVPLDISFSMTFRGLESFTATNSIPMSDLAVWCMSNYIFPSVPMYKVTTVSALLAGPAVVLTDVALFAIVSFLWRQTGRTPPSTRILKSFITLKLYICLPRITELSLLPFGCYYVGTSRLLMDTRVECTSDSHLNWLMVACVSFFTFPLGLPFLLFLILRYYKVRDRLKEPEVQGVFGFLENGLEPQLYFFECIFMLRKVVFLFLVKLPGHSEVSSAIQAFSLMFASGFFLLLHLWFRPYDNRAYFLLDEMEGASLLAVFITLVSQVSLWSIEDHLVLQLHTTHRRLCTILVYTLVGLLHARFLFLVVWGLLRRIILEQLFHGQPPMWLAKGQVGVTETGLELRGLSRRALLLLESLFAELLGEYVDQGFVGFASFRTALQRVCVCANYVAKKRKYTSLDPMKQGSRFLQEQASKLPVGGPQITNALQRLDTFWREQRRSMCSVSESTEVHALALDMGFYVHRATSLGQEIEKLNEYSKENRQRTIGEHFTVEDLYEALLLLGKDVCKDDPEADADKPEDSVQLSSEGAQPRSGYPSSSASENMAALDELQVLETELRAKRSECNEQRLLAESAMKECELLRDRLRKLEGGVRNSIPATELKLAPLAAEVTGDPSSLQLSTTPLIEGNCSACADARFKLKVDPLVDPCPMLQLGTPSERPADRAELGVESSSSMKSDLVSEPLPEPFSAPCTPVWDSPPGLAGNSPDGGTPAVQPLLTSLVVLGTLSDSSTEHDPPVAAEKERPRAGELPKNDPPAVVAAGAPVARGTAGKALRRAGELPKNGPPAVVAAGPAVARGTVPPPVKPREIECEPSTEEVCDLVVDETALETERAFRDSTTRSAEERRGTVSLGSAESKWAARASTTRGAEKRHAMEAETKGAVRNSTTRSAEEHHEDRRPPRQLPALCSQLLEKADLAWEKAAAAALENSSVTGDSLDKPVLDVWVPNPQLQLAGSGPSVGWQS